MIRVYKEDLEKAGIYIDAIIGPYGGYVLNQSVRMPVRKFKMKDAKLLDKYIESEKDKDIKDEQIENIFIKQNNWVAIISIIFGLPMGFYLTDWLFKTAIEEHYDFGAFITTRTYIISAIGTFIVSFLVSKFLARKIKKIDMVTSLKGNE